MGGRTCGATPSRRSESRPGQAGTLAAGPVAQLAEQRTFNPRVVGSSPTGPTHQERCVSRLFGGSALSETTIDLTLGPSGPRGSRRTVGRGRRRAPRGRRRRDARWVESHGGLGVAELPLHRLDAGPGGDHPTTPQCGAGRGCAALGRSRRRPAPASTRCGGSSGRAMVRLTAPCRRGDHPPRWGDGGRGGRRATTA